MPDKISSTPNSRNRNITLEQHIGNRVLLMRHAQKLHIKDVSSKIGVSYQQLQKYEKGQNRIAASTLYQLAKYFNVSVDFFYNGYKGENNSDVPKVPEAPEGARVMYEINKIENHTSRKRVYNQIAPIIDALAFYYQNSATNKSHQ